jgi:hypothetical protein
MTCNRRQFDVADGIRPGGNLSALSVVLLVSVL